MRLFDPRQREMDVDEARRYAAFEMLHTVADFVAALLFVVGSILFFFEQTMTTATWAFLGGSICFLLKPSIRLARELWLGRHDRIDRLASAAPEAPAPLPSRAEDDRDDSRED